MISYADDPRLCDELRRFTAQENIFACKIACLQNSYGTGYDFVRFWIQTDGSGRTVSAVSKYYSDVTVQLSEDSDIDELREFLECTGFSSVLSEREIVCCGEVRQGTVMKLRDRSKCLDRRRRNIESDCYPELRDVHELLVRCSGRGFEVPKYEDFLLDMSHKIRHGTGECIALRQGGRIVSCALTVAQSVSCVVVGAVASDPDFRGQGFGSACAAELCSHFEQTVFIMREKDMHEDFYGNLGFENSGVFYITSC